MIAAYAEGRKWTFQGDVDLKSKFWGRSIELMPQGALLLDFHDGDQYVWHKVLPRPEHPLSATGRPVCGAQAPAPALSTPGQLCCVWHRTGKGRRPAAVRWATPFQQSLLAPALLMPVPARTHLIMQQAGHAATPRRQHQHQPHAATCGHMRPCHSSWTSAAADSSWPWCRSPPR